MDLERVEGCYKLLLDADSDLTAVALEGGRERLGLYWSPGFYWTSAYSRALIYGSFVSLSRSDLVSTT